MRQTPAALLVALVAFTSFYFQGLGGSPAATPPSAREAPAGSVEGHPATGAQSAVSATCGVVKNELEEIIGSRSETGPLAEKVRAHTRFLIATVPDPVHTYLALEFDRLVEGIQQAAAESGYTFQSATLPWPISPESRSSDEAEISEIKTEGLAKYYLKVDKVNRSSKCPGSLIFRKHVKPGVVEPYSEYYLVVLLVAEKPTAGVNTSQFLSVLETVKENNERIIGILGPNFSGSYSSLDRLLTLSDGGAACPTQAVTPAQGADSQRNPFFVIRSSSTMSGEEINWFRARNHCRASLLSFFDPVEYQQSKIMQFLGRDAQVAVLSEDETAYGKSDSPGLRVYFPRGIATLRAAYQEDASLATDPERSRAPRTTLKTDFGTSGEDEDTVPTYDVKHVPLSQEAVLQEIVRTLRLHRAKFVIIRATDVMDTLFLAGRLRKSYPEGRLIALGADLLARRDMDDNALRGTLAVSNYPPFQGWIDDDPQAAADIHRIFADSTQEGEFNAALDLIRETENPATIARKHSGPLTLPQAPYAGFMAPSLDGKPTSANLRPQLWISAVGRDGYWPLTILSTDELNDEQARNKPSDLSASPEPCNLTIDGEKVACGPRPAAELEGPNIQETKYSGLSIEWSWIKLSVFKTVNLKFPVPRVSLDRGFVLNGFVVLLLTVISALFVYSSWWGNISNAGSVIEQQLGPLRDPRRARLLLIGSMVLLVAWSLAIMSWPVFVPWIILASSVICSTWTFQKELLTETVLSLTATAAVTLTLYFLARPPDPVTQYIFLYRANHFSSGLSPNLPLLLICGAVLWWTWYQLRARSAFDIRRPLLPRGDGLTQIPSHDRFGNAGSARTLLLRPNFLILAIGTVLAFWFQRLRLHSLEGINLDRIYNLALCLGLVLLLSSLYGAWVYWRRCRDLLVALNRTPLRYSFMEISGFEWRRVWGLAGADSAFAYRPLVRAWQALQRLHNSLDVTGQSYLANANDKLLESAGQLIRQLEPIQKVLGKVDIEQRQRAGNPVLKLPVRLRDYWLGRGKRQLDFNLHFCRRMELVQSQLSSLVTMVYQCVLDEYWKQDARWVTRDPKKNGKGSEDRVREIKSSVVGGLVPPSVQWAEEFVALVYVSFIVRVLIRIRWLGMAAIGIYVFLLLAATVYPFEPKGTIHAFFVFVFLAMLGTIGLIYAQMHRDDTLSHLTDTVPGQLGGDYWWRMTSFAGVPLFTLVTTQVPQLSRALFFWVKPLLDGIGKG